MKIEALSEAGVYQKDIAEQLEISSRTVARALTRGEAPKRVSRRRGTSKLNPYKSELDRLMAVGVWNAAVLLREIQAKGYGGGRTLLRQYIQPKRALRAGRATVRFETEPGVQLQSDWGEQETLVGGVPTKVEFIVNTLGFSRRMHFWCTLSHDAEHTYEGLIRSFEYFGGTPREVLVDNQKAAVLSHPADGSATFNTRFVDLAGHYGFKPRACKPYRARTKGKDERMVSYIKHNFFQRYRKFDDFPHLNQLAEMWLREEADPRVHGTVQEVVSARFEREQPTLQTMPLARFDTSYFETRQVSMDGYIDVRGNRYSVPSERIGQRVDVRIALNGKIRVFAGESCVAEHMQRATSAGWGKVSAHHADLWASTLNRDLVVQQRSLQVYAEVAA